MKLLLFIDEGKSTGLASRKNKQRIKMRRVRAVLHYVDLHFVLGVVSLLIIVVLHRRRGVEQMFQLDVLDDRRRVNLRASSVCAVVMKSTALSLMYRSLLH